MPKKIPIILASTSPRRKQLLSQIGLNYTVVQSDYVEDMTEKISNTALAKKLALGKAQAVAKRLKNGIVIGADTFVVYQGKRLGKPKNENDAVRMLKMLSGKKMKIYSGIAIIDIKNNKIVNDCEVSQLKFKKLNNKEILSYIRTKEPMDKAGAFAIQGISAVFIEKINGCYSNIIGLPLNNLYKNLLKLNIDIFNN